MNLTRRAMRNEIRTLTAQLDQARQELDRLQADLYEATDIPLQDRLVRALRHVEFLEADNDRQQTELDDVHERLAALAARFPTEDIDGP